MNTDFPQIVQFQYGEQWYTAAPAGERFETDKARLTLRQDDAGLHVQLASREPISYVKLRWRHALPAGARVLGDAVERAYGDLAWECVNPYKQLMWYCFITAGGRTEGFGVSVRPAAICFWQVDPDGVTLWLDVRCGGDPVRLGGRVLDVCTVLFADSREGETPFRFTARFCRLLSPAPRLPSYALYGVNTWLYTYGYLYSDMSRESILRDCRFYADLAGPCENRPAMVVDDGWNAHIPQHGGACGGPHTGGNDRFPEMETFAQAIREQGCRPGLWARLLPHYDETLPRELFLQRSPDTAQVLDPSHPEALRIIEQETQRLCGWGFELLKHDFSWYDLMGEGTLQTNWRLTPRGWHFYDTSRTSAEILIGLYAAIRQAAGDTALIACNCPGHLCAGLTEYYRIGGDTSGYVWDRTRKFGVNSLAFRLCQHRAFYELDADCVGHRDEYIPWEYTQRFMDLLAYSNTPLLLSIDPAELRDPKRQAAVADAFARSRARSSTLEPLDWMDNPFPEHWEMDGKPVRLPLSLPEGTLNFGSLTQFEWV